ncbi:MAG: ion transporter, partial [Planctomycetota bacterium]
NAYADAFRVFESVSIAAFTVEYLVRLWSCTADPRYAGPLTGRLRWMLSPMALIDLAAIAPFYLAFVGLDLRAIRVLRLVKMLRLAKISRYTAAINLLAKVLGERKSELLAVFSMAAVVVLFSSIGMYYAERAHQPDEFESVPQAMLWTIMNLTPLSATSARPVTPIGLGLSVVVAVVGVGVIAMPTGIIGAGFVEHIRKRRTEPRCPHCGKAI